MERDTLAELKFIQLETAALIPLGSIALGFLPETVAPFIERKLATLGEFSESEPIQDLPLLALCRGNIALGIDSQIPLSMNKCGRLRRQLNSGR